MKHIFKKTVCVIVSVLMMIPMFSASAYTTDNVIKAASELIFSNEGYYTSINANDKGAISIGVLGWHANRALSLLKTIINDIPEDALEILGEELYNEIITSSNWNNRTFNDAESECVSALLGTQAGIDAQDALAYTDIESYIKHALTLGITDGKALVYFADLENQMGSVGAERVAVAAIAIAQSPENVKLEDMYNAAMADSTASSSPTRRLNSYNFCMELDLDNIETSNYYPTGKYKTTASYLCVRGGPSKAYDTVTSDLKKGTSVTVTEVKGEWGKVNIDGITGWICLMYAELIAADNIEVTVLGDVTGNNTVEAADARLILRYSASLTKFSESQKKCADVNSDGNITAQDARITLRVSAKLDSF